MRAIVILNDKNCITNTEAKTECSVIHTFDFPWPPTGLSFQVW